MAHYILSHDLSTGGDKASLYAPSGRLLGSELCEYPTYYPDYQQVEQRPEDWWRTVCLSTKRLLEKTGISPADVAVISFSGIMMSCVLVGQDGEPLRPALIWADTRASREEALIKERLGLREVYRLTGHRVGAAYSAAKLLWIREHEPEVYQRADKMLNAKDYIIYKMTGEYVTDYSDACGTNLFDIEKKVWSEDLVRALEIEKHLLPEAHPSTDVAGKLTKQAAEALGLVEGTPVVIGGGDGACACVGAGVVKEGDAYCALSSSSWISTVSRAPVFDEEMRTFTWPHPDPSLYAPCGTMQAAGYSYSWFRDALCEAEVICSKQLGISKYALINEAVESTPPGAGGLIYLPYLLGERSPHWNLDARGAFIGMAATTKKAQMARAVLEGVAMNLKTILSILKEHVPIADIRLTGGGARGEIWRQILADVWQMPAIVPKVPDGAAALGAAVTAGVGVGIFEDFSVAGAMNPAAVIIAPRAEYAPLYDRLYAAFQTAYAGLAETFGLLGPVRELSPAERGRKRL